MSNGSASPTQTRELLDAWNTLQTHISERNQGAPARKDSANSQQEQKEEEVTGANHETPAPETIIDRLKRQREFLDGEVVPALWGSHNVLSMQTLMPL